MVKTFIEVVRERILFNLQVTLLGLYIFSVFFMWQISNIVQIIDFTDFYLNVIFYVCLGIALILILISHSNIGVYFGLKMAFDRAPEQIIMISPKAQIVSVIFDAIIVSPYFLFKNFTDNILVQFFNTHFFIITIFVIFVGIIVEIIMTDRTFSKYDEKIKIEEKVESDYKKIKTSLN